MSTADAAAALGVSDSTVRRWISSGYLPEPGWSRKGARKARAFDRKWIDAARKKIDLPDRSDTSLRISLTFSVEDLHLARRLQTQLEANGATVITPSVQNEFGGSWVESISGFYDSSDVFVFLVGPRPSRWLSVEAEQAVERARLGHTLVVPVLAREASYRDMPAALRSFQGLSLDETRDLDSAARLIVDAARDLRARGNYSGVPSLPEAFIETGFVREVLSAIEQGPSDRVIWLQGVPGSGKTVAAAAAAQLFATRLQSVEWLRYGRLRDRLADESRRYFGRGAQLLVIDEVEGELPNDVRDMLHERNYNVVIITSRQAPPKALPALVIAARLSRTETREILSKSLTLARNSDVVITDELVDLADGSPLFASLLAAPGAAASLLNRPDETLEGSVVGERIVQVLSWASPTGLPRELFLDQYEDPYLLATAERAERALSVLRDAGAVQFHGNRVFLANVPGAIGYDAGALALLRRGVVRMRAEGWVEPLSKNEVTALVDRVMSRVVRRGVSEEIFATVSLAIESARGLEPADAIGTIRAARLLLFGQPIHHQDLAMDASIALAEALLALGLYREAAAVAAAEFIEAGSADPTRSIQLLLLLSRAQDLAGDTASAIQALMQTIDLQREALGNSPTVAQSLAVLAELNFRTGMLEDARLAAVSSYEISEKALGAAHTNTLRSQLLLAQVLDALGDDQGSAMLVDQVLRLSGEVLGPNHSVTLAALSLQRLAVDD